MPVPEQESTTHDPQSATPSSSEPVETFAEYEAKRQPGLGQMPVVPEVKEPKQPAAEKAKTGDESGPSETPEEKAERERNERGQFTPGVQKRIDKLTAQKSAAERQAKALAERLAKYEPDATAGDGQQDPSQAAPGKETKAPSAQERRAAQGFNFEKPAPLEKDFPTYGEFLVALADWAGDKKLAEYKHDQAVEAAQKAAQAQAEQAVGNWTKQLEEAKEADPDFDYQAAVEAVVEKIGGTEVDIALPRLSNAVDVLKHLHDNPKVTDELVSLEGIDQIVRLGEISAELKAKRGPRDDTDKSTPRKEVSRAPKPPATVQTRSQEPRSLAQVAEKGTFAEYEKARIADLKGRRL